MDNREKHKVKKKKKKIEAKVIFFLILFEIHSDDRQACKGTHGK